MPAIPDLVVPWRGGWGDRVPLSCCAGGFLAGAPEGSTVPQWVVGVGGRRCCLWLCTVWLLCCCVWAVPCLVGCCVASRWVAAVAGAGGLVGVCRRWLVWHCFLVSFGCRGGGQELVRGAGGEVDSPPHSCEGQQGLIPHLKSHGAWLMLAGCGDLGDCGQPSSPVIRVSLSLFLSCLALRLLSLSLFHAARRVYVRRPSACYRALEKR